MKEPAGGLKWYNKMKYLDSKVLAKKKLVQEINVIRFALNSSNGSSKKSNAILKAVAHSYFTCHSVKAAGCLDATRQSLGAYELDDVACHC